MAIKANKIEVPTIAIVGRPNVGKSSLFNSIVGRRLAIVHEESGVTRDRIMAPVVHKGKHFQIVDTGGLGVFSNQTKNVGHWDMEIRSQVDAAIADADILLFVTDIQEGLSPLDEGIAIKLRECGKKTVMVPNKADNLKLEKQADEFGALGFNDICPISTLHRRGIGIMLDIALEGIKSYEDIESKAPFSIAVVGRPNVGKSSMVNRLLGEDRVMVSEIAGTTRDSVDVEFELEYKGEKLPATLIDTAGLRKKSKVDSAVELFSGMRAQSAIKRARMVLFLVEAGPDGLTSQDKHIAQIIADCGKGCVIVANKWDTCTDLKQKHALEEIRRTLPRMTYAPVVFTSTLDGYNFDLMMDCVAEIMEQMEVHVPTSTLNKTLNDAFEFTTPPAAGRSSLRLYYATMIGNEPPRFMLFVNDPKHCPAHYLGYLNNYLRRCFGLTGLPIVIDLRARKRGEFIIAKPKTKRPAAKLKPDSKKKLPPKSKRPGDKKKEKPGDKKKVYAKKKATTKKSSSRNKATKKRK